MTYVRSTDARLFHIATQRVADGRAPVRCKPDPVKADEVQYNRPEDGVLCAKCELATPTGKGDVRPEEA